MNKINPFLIGIIAVIIIGLGWGISTYNSFVSKNEGITTAWAQVESQYQRRLDLIPNLVNSVKGVMAQEKEIFEAIAVARTQYGGATTPSEKALAAGNMESALSRLLVIMENYPVLRSIEAVTSLMTELAGTENRIAVERMRYNEVVRDYNVMVKTVPSKLIANWFGFAPATPFEAAEGAQNAPQVSF
jgi:LemA protein